MIMENTKLAEVSQEQAIAEGHFKYICVVLQYGGKLNKNKLIDAVRELEGPRAAAKKQYNMRLVAEQLSHQLSGASAVNRSHYLVAVFSKRMTQPLIT